MATGEQSGWERRDASGGRRGAPACAVWSRALMGVLLVAGVALTPIVLIAGCQATMLSGPTAVPTAPSSPTAAVTPTATYPPQRGTGCSDGVCTAESQKRCGDGVCDGPETPDNCPGDCGLPTPAPDPVVTPMAQPLPAPQGVPGQRPGVHWVRNPTSDVDLFVRVVTPEGWDGETALPALVLVPGGRGAGSAYLAASGGTGSEAQAIADSGGFAVVVFDPDGRGQSGGEEDDGGFIHQDGLAAVITYVANLPEIDGTRTGVVSYSYGVTMATGALARHPDLPVVFLIDWEGPANRDDTGGCGAGEGEGATPVGHLQDAGCDNEAFWAQREAETFARSLQVPYQRLQSREDHVQPDLGHAIRMLANATAAAYGGRGASPWTRLNRLAPNSVYSVASLPELPPPGSPAAGDVAGYAQELFALFASGAGGGTTEAGED